MRAVLDPDDRVLLVVRVSRLERLGDAGRRRRGRVRRGGAPRAGRGGARGFDLGPLVWKRTHLVELDEWDGQVERYYLVRTAAFEPAPSLSWEQLNPEFVTAVRWWTLAELEAADGRFRPAPPPGLIRELVANGPPAEPIDAGV